MRKVEPNSASKSGNLELVEESNEGKLFMYRNWNGKGPPFSLLPKPAFPMFLYGTTDYLIFMARTYEYVAILFYLIPSVVNKMIR
jgi:hypothetical protein